MHDIEDAAAALNKIFAIILLILGPIGLFVLVIHGVKAIGSDHETTIQEWILSLCFTLGTSYLGIYMCRREFGWFQRKK